MLWPFVQSTRIVVVGLFELGTWPATQPFLHGQDTDDVAQMAVMLASARSKNITGQTINVDGGQVMR